MVLDPRARRQLRGAFTARGPRPAALFSNHLCCHLVTPTTGAGLPRPLHTLSLLLERSSTFHGYILISQSQLTGWLRERPRADSRGPVSTRPHLLCSEHVLLRASVSTWPLVRILALGRRGLTLLCPQGWVGGVAHPRWSAMFADCPLECQQTGPGERPGPLCKGSWASTWVGWM